MIYTIAILFLFNSYLSYYLEPSLRTKKKKDELYLVHLSTNHILVFGTNHILVFGNNW